MVLVAKPMFWGMWNHLGPFSEVSDRPEDQEQGGGAVGSQEGLQVVKSNLGSNSDSEHARDMVLVSKPMFWGIRNLLEMVPNDSTYHKTLVLPPVPCL